jgi:hypothetical protein
VLEVVAVVEDPVVLAEGVVAGIARSNNGF